MLGRFRVHFHILQQKGLKSPIFRTIWFGLGSVCFFKISVNNAVLSMGDSILFGLLEPGAEIQSKMVSSDNFV